MTTPNKGFLAMGDEKKENGEFRTSLGFVKFKFHVCRGVYSYNQKISLKRSRRGYSVGL